MHFVERLNKKINKLICVGPCFNGLIDNVDWSSDIGWQEVKASMKIDYNPEKVKQNTKDWKVFLSDNDEFILYDLATKHFDEAGVEHIDFEKAGHFTTKD
jgi:predicted alpha/beta hydrolase family esterase